MSVLLLLGGAGCRGTYPPASGTRVWADWNTLCAPALYVEKFDHHPPQKQRIDYYRWMYGGKAAHVIPTYSVVAAESAPVVSPDAAESSDALPQELPPPAPPATSSGDEPEPRRKRPLGPSAAEDRRRR